MKTTKSKPDSKLQSRNQMAHLSSATGSSTSPSSSPTPPPAPAPASPVPQSPATLASAASTWRGVFFDGPQPDRNRDGDEIPVWSVYVGDDEGIPVGRVYHVYAFSKAQALAVAMAKDRNLELITDALPENSASVAA